MSGVFARVPNLSLSFASKQHFFILESLPRTTWQ
jgi:hypothetical protein